MSIATGSETPTDSLDHGEPAISQTFRRSAFLASTRRWSEIQNIRPALDILSQWLVISVVIAVTLYVDAWPVWLLAAIVIATRQHALLVLMHEATHHHLFRSLALSEVVADLFCAFPMNITTAGYRHEHMLHHQHTNTPGDPYWVVADVDPATWKFPRTRLGALRVYLFDLIGVHALRHVKIIWPWTYAARLLGLAEPRVNSKEHLRYLAFTAALITALTLTDAWLSYAVLWLLPSLTILMANFRLRALAEHSYLRPGRSEIVEARHVDGTGWERFLFAPLNINYHLAHHTFPSIPYYNLPRMHALLARRGVYQLGRNYFPRYLAGPHSVLAYLTSGGAAEADEPGLGSEELSVQPAQQRRIRPE